MGLAILGHLLLRGAAGAMAALFVLDAIESNHWFGLFLDCDGATNFGSCSGVEYFWWFALVGAILGILLLSLWHKA